MKFFNRLLILTLTAIAAQPAIAAIPPGWYDSLTDKNGDQLLAAIKELAANHKKVEYSTETWPSFETTDVRMINGRQAWFDMYSNNLVYLPEHAALNIEHSVANSWWGGKTGSPEAYSDLFHLNPSDQNANNKKSNYPPAELTDARLFDNGLFRVGTPAEGLGGGAKSAFEPADEYKGDFARSYFYIFTAYPDIEWKAADAYVCDGDGKLRPWAADMLMKWHRQDPPDSKEMARNDEVARLQGNRNPFIDYPELAEYLWGSRSGQSVKANSLTPAGPIDRPQPPKFAGARTVGVNTYALRWWDGYSQQILADDGILMVSIDGRDFYPSSGELQIDAAADKSEKHSYLAYTEKEIDGLTLRSSISRLDIVARDPNAIDYSGGRWSRLLYSSDFNPENGPYVILSSNTLHSMSISGGSSSTAFMESAGFVEFDGDMITDLPIDAAVLHFDKVDDEKYRLNIKDIYGNFKGSWNATAKNKMKLSDTTYTPGTGKISESDALVWTFDSFGSLQFNKTQPRFLNYESNQTPVLIYKFIDFNGGYSQLNDTHATPWTVGMSGDTLILPPGTRLYDITGRNIDPNSATHGIYIVSDGTRSIKIIK